LLCLHDVLFGDIRPGRHAGDMRYPRRFPATPIADLPPAPTVAPRSSRQRHLRRGWANRMLGQNTRNRTDRGYTDCGKPEANLPMDISASSPCASLSAWGTRSRLHENGVVAWRSTTSPPALARSRCSVLPPLPLSGSVRQSSGDHLGRNQSPFDVDVLRISWLWHPNSPTEFPTCDFVAGVLADDQAPAFCAGQPSPRLRTRQSDAFVEISYVGLLTNGWTRE
jgi:hypothetical protein